MLSLRTFFKNIINIPLLTLLICILKIILKTITIIITIIQIKPQIKQTNKNYPKISTKVNLMAETNSSLNTSSCPTMTTKTTKNKPMKSTLRTSRVNWWTELRRRFLILRIMWKKPKWK